MKKSLRLLIPIVLIGALAVGVGFAQPAIKADQSAARVVASLGDLKDAPRLRMVIRHVIRELDLTEQQVDAARDVLKIHGKEVSAAVDKVALARADLRKVIRTKPADGTALAAVADEVAAAQRELVLATATLRVDLRQLLTPEQLVKLETLETRLTERVDKARGVLARWVAAA